MGTPRFAVPSLRTLLEYGHEVVAVFTQPDRPAGRDRAARPSAVKQFAVEHGIVVEQPQKLRDPAAIELVRAWAPELIAVAAYGKILPKVLLELPRRGAINVHGSLLPRHRGAAPIQRALLAGEPSTGITIMQMNEGMDTGDILLQEETPIRPDDTSVSLAERLAEIGARLLVEALARLQRGELVARKQDDALATLAPMVRKEEGASDWSRSAVEIERAVRACTPWPGAYTTLGGKLLKVHRAAVGPAASSAAGTVERASGDEIQVATGNGLLRLLEVQLESKRRLAASDFLAGQLLRVGDKLG